MSIAQALRNEQVPDSFVETFYEAAQRVEATVEVSFDELSNNDLVTVYRLVNQTKKVAEKARSRAKDSVTNRFKSAAEEEANGRLVLPDIAPEGMEEVDEVLRLSNEQGEAVEYRPRTKLNFLQEVAREILEDKGLLPLAVERTVVVTDIEALSSAMENALQALVDAGADGAAKTLRATFNEATETREAVSEAKVEKLVKDDKLSLDDAEKMYEERVSYALYG